jgi:uncharacterized membrane protein
MRQMIVQVPAGSAARVMEASRRLDAMNVSHVRGENDAGAPVDLVVVHVANRDVGTLLAALEELDDVHISMFALPVLALEPPASQVPEQVEDVTLRTPLEIYVSGLQSIGGWKGFLGYAAAAGGVVWLALTTNMSFLLIGAMLIAPYAGPAMNTAIATARGDATLLRQSLLRYGASLLVTALTAALLAWLFGVEAATEAMLGAANISTATVLLPLIAGAAGALHLTQSRQSSLVSGASVGILVAASLAPPAGLLGIAPVTGDWSMMSSAIFLLLLQLAGINLAGAITFWGVGLRPRGVRYDRGRTAILVLGIAVSAVLLAALLTWQRASDPPTLERASAAQRARAVAARALRDEPGLHQVRLLAEFTRSQVPGREPLLVTAYVLADSTITEPDTSVRSRVRALLARAITRAQPTIRPLVDVTVLRVAPGDAR